MLLVTEYDSALEVEGRVPPSMIRKTYIREGAVPTLNTSPTIFGEPLHFIYLGYNLRAVETFVKSLQGDTKNIILISPISRWGLYSVKLKHLQNLSVSNQFDTRESKVRLVQNLTGLSAKKATLALTLLQYNFSLVEKNLDLLRWCHSTGSDVETAIASVEYYSYQDILFYLCGSKKHTKEKFIRTLARYRYGKKSILKYMKDVLDEFISVKLDGEKPSKDMEHTIQKLSFFLYLEDAMRLRYTLNNVTHLTDLLKGEL